MYPAGLSGSEPSDLVKPEDLVVLPFPPPTANFPKVNNRDQSILPLPAFTETEEDVVVSSLKWLFNEQCSYIT